MKLHPTNDRILVLPDPETTVSAGGIHLVSDVRDGSSRKGAVQSVGSKVVDTDNLKPGAKVYFPRFGGQEVEVDKKKFVLIPEEEILGVEVE